MNFSPANVLAGSFAVLLHAGVAGAFLLEWDSEAPEAVTPEKTYYIPAKMYNENPHTAKQQREAAAAQARQQRQEANRRREAERQEQLRKQKAIDEERARQLAQQQEADRLARLKAEQLAADKLARELKERELKEREEAERRREAEQLQAGVDDELQKLINAELDAIAAVTNDEKAMAYVGQIQADIIQNWSRPPSARNGMQTLLKVYLVPTGEVVDVSVLTSSGNEAFDRSAIQAVRKVRRFDVPRDAKLFEDKFREFEVLFRPEDLRL